MFPEHHLPCNSTLVRASVHVVLGCLLHKKPRSVVEVDEMLDVQSGWCLFALLVVRLATKVLLQFLTCTAVLLSLAQLFLVVDGWLPNVLSYYVSGIFTFVTMVRFAQCFIISLLLFKVDILVLSLLCRSKGVVSSGVIHITWLLVVVSNLPQLLWWIEQFKLQSVQTKTIGNQSVKAVFRI